MKVLSIFGVFLFLVGSGLVFYFSGEIAQQACSNAFNNAYNEAMAQTYDNFYQAAYNYCEEQNHVSNSATISIGSIKEENALEVLSVSENWIKISDSSQDSNRTTRWVEFTGTGVYTVDMSLSEFIIDDYNKFILVNVKSS